MSTRMNHTIGGQRSHPIGRRVAAAVAVSVTVALAGATHAHAESNTPSQPIIEQIAARATGGSGTVAVTVTFGRAGTKPWATVQATEVTIGASGPTATCTLESVPAGKTLEISARARNISGFGPWSPPVPFRAKAGTFWK